MAPCGDRQADAQVNRIDAFPPGVDTDFSLSYDAFVPEQGVRIPMQDEDEAYAYRRGSWSFVFDLTLTNDRADERERRVSVRVE